MGLGTWYTFGMKPEIHGTINDPKFAHPVFDARHWLDHFPLKDDDRRAGSWIASPEDLTKREHKRRLAEAQGDCGPSVPADVFVWASSRLYKKPWLTRIGGGPWRERGKPWPKAANGVPLVFLGQICFADSKDFFPFKLPGEVALIFGTYSAGWIDIDEESALEWSPMDLKEPDEFGASFGTLPFVLQGVLHRTVQYTDHKKADEPFLKAGFKDGAYELGSIQATAISTHASLPQGWPFEPGDGNTLVATLSSFYCDGEWPMCDVPRSMGVVRPDGSEYSTRLDAMSFGIGDAGCIWIYRDKTGKFKLDSACG